MRTSSASARRIARLVVDANPILSALIGGRARDIFLSPAIEEFATTVKTLNEVLEYIPIMAHKNKRIRGIEADLYAALAAMPLRVYKPDFYSIRGVDLYTTAQLLRKLGL